MISPAFGNHNAESASEGGEWVSAMQYAVSMPATRFEEVDNFGRQAKASLAKQQSITSPGVEASPDPTDAVPPTSDAAPPPAAEEAASEPLVSASAPAADGPSPADDIPAGDARVDELLGPGADAMSVELVDEMEELETVYDMTSRPTTGLKLAGVKSYVTCLKQRLNDLCRQYTGGARLTDCG